MRGTRDVFEMVNGEIPEASVAAEVLFQVVRPLLMGWKFGLLAMVNSEW